MIIVIFEAGQFIPAFEMNHQSLPMLLLCPYRLNIMDGRDWIWHLNCPPILQSAHLFGRIAF
jgi:hypothetical protein